MSRSLPDFDNSERNSAPLFAEHPYSPDKRGKLIGYLTEDGRFWTRTGKPSHPSGNPNIPNKAHGERIRAAERQGYTTIIDEHGEIAQPFKAAADLAEIREDDELEEAA